MNFNRKDLIIFFILFFLTIGIIFFNQSITVKTARGSLAAVARPLQIFFVSGRNFFSFWRDVVINVRSLKIENQNLIQKNLELEAKIAALAGLEEESNLLKNQLGIAREEEWKLMAADIVGRDYQNYRSFLINKGLLDGLKPGMSVLGAGQNVIGQIIFSEEKISQVRTVFDVETKISAVTQKTQVQGLVKGIGLGLVLDLVSKSKDLEVGEIVFSSGQDRNWPKRLILGKITSIESNPGQIFQTAAITSQLDWSKLEMVFIILN